MKQLDEFCASRPAGAWFVRGHKAVDWASLHEPAGFPGHFWEQRVDLEAIACAPEALDPGADVRAELYVDGRAQVAFVPPGDDGRHVLGPLDDWSMGPRYKPLIAEGVPYLDVRPSRALHFQVLLPIAPLRGLLSDHAPHTVELRVRAGRAAVAGKLALTVKGNP
jgi:hypothetical protein